MKPIPNFPVGAYWLSERREQFTLGNSFTQYQTEIQLFINESIYIIPSSINKNHQSLITTINHTFIAMQQKYLMRKKLYSCVVNFHRHNILYRWQPLPSPIHKLLRIGKLMSPREPYRRFLLWKTGNKINKHCCNYW